MKTKQILVCDPDENYLLHFLNYVNQKKNPLFAAKGFRSREELAASREAGEGQSVILLSELLEQELEESFSGKNVILLVEEPWQGKQEKAVYKYQSGRKLLSQLLSLCAEEAEEEKQVALRPERMKCIAVYSPVGRCGKTDFAVTLGKELSRKKRTLYLNLEAWSGFEVLYGDSEQTLSELLYYLNQGKGAFPVKLESVIQRMGNLEYIPPFRVPGELCRIPGEEWKKLLDTLERESWYEILILDPDCAMDGLPELLERCEAVYMPVKEDERAKAKIRQYEETLEALGLEQVREREERFCFKSYEELETAARNCAGRWCGE